MSNIEDDLYEIKKLKIFLIFYKTHGWIPNIDRTIDVEKSIQCIENILSDYRRQKEMNEEHQKINGELREKVKELEEEKALLKKASNIAKEVNIEDVTDVINESCKEFMSNYIPKQAVIEALEDIEDYFDRLNGPDEDIEYIRQVKNELLGEEK